MQDEAQDAIREKVRKKRAFFPNSKFSIFQNLYYTHSVYIAATIFIFQSNAPDGSSENSPVVHTIGKTRMNFCHTLKDFREKRPEFILFYPNGVRSFVHSGLQMQKIPKFYAYGKHLPDFPTQSHHQADKENIIDFSFALPKAPERFAAQQIRITAPIDS